MAVPVSTLKRSLGDCWADGALTTETESCPVTLSDLPLGAAAKTSLDFGNAPLLLVTSVPTSE